MSEYDSDILRLGGQGYCCSQILLLLALEMQGESNPGLVRAMQGLCEGGGRLDATCGVFSGGQALLAYYLGKGEPGEQTDSRLAVLQEEFGTWFNGQTPQEGDISCGALVPDPASRLLICPALIGESLEQLFSLLLEAGVELDQIKGA